MHLHPKLRSALAVVILMAMFSPVVQGRWSAATSVLKNRLAVLDRNGIVNLVTFPNITWTSFNSTTRIYFEATSNGDLVFFAGGSLNDQTVGVGPTALFTIYDAKTNIWTSSSLSLARSSLAVTSVANIVLVGGGSIGGVPTDRVDLYDITTRSWNIGSLSQARSSLTATSVIDVALFAGGNHQEAVTNDTVSSVVDIYNATSKSWTIASLSVARDNLASTSTGKVALFAGGWRNRNPITRTDAVDIYDASSNTWRTATLSRALPVLSAVRIHNLAVFGAGWGPNLDVYNHLTDTWTVIPYRVIQSPEETLAVLGNYVFTRRDDFVPFFPCSETNSTACLSCSPGFRFSSDLAECVSCPPGSYSDGSTRNCTLCDPGSYSPAGSGSCNLCPAGTFSSPCSGNGACLPCSAGTFSPLGSIWCVQCRENTFSKNASAECTPCPVGTEASFGSQQCYNNTVLASHSKPAQEIPTVFETQTTQQSQTTQQLSSCNTLGGSVVVSFILFNL